jgi:preprotein translocase subunit SecG
VSGVLNAIVFSLLIARLDSKLIGLPSWLICVLYLYASVQPLFVIFAQQGSVYPEMETVILIFAFISKIYFFLIILYTLQTGRMLNYLFCFPELSRRVNQAIAHEARARKEIGKKKRAIGVRTRIFSKMGSDTILRIVFLIGAAASAYFFVSVIGYAARRQEMFSVRPATIDKANIVFAALVVIFLLILRSIKSDGRSLAKQIFKKIFGIEGVNSKDFQRSKKGSQKQLQRFTSYFLCFWCATLLLYLILFKEHHAEALNRLTETVVYSTTGALIKLGYPFLGFMLNTINLGFLFCCFVILYIPAYDEKSDKRQRLIIHYAGFVVTMLILSFPLLSFSITSRPHVWADSLESYQAIFDGVVGTLSALALALLIARLDSKLIGLKTGYVVILFSYAAIQPLYVVFHQRNEAFDTIKTSVLLAAFGFKICLFLVIFHMLLSGSLLRYLLCFPFLNKRVDSIFENQFDIRIYRQHDQSFTFEVRKKNALVYSSNHSSNTRNECDKRIEYLRELIKYDEDRKDVEKYLRMPPQVAGTVWVELRDAAGDLILESAPLRSKEEADDLILQSIDKIPYCKYSRV